jgi:hypothetical protein
MPVAVAAVDLDRAHTPDLVTVNALSGSLSSLLSSLPPRFQCAGDCNDQGSVALDELVLVVNVALGQVPVEECVAADSDGLNAVTIDEVVKSIDNALHGCASASN